MLEENKAGGAVIKDGWKFGGSVRVGFFSQAGGVGFGSKDGEPVAQVVCPPCVSKFTMGDA